MSIRTMMVVVLALGAGAVAACSDAGGPAPGQLGIRAAAPSQARAVLLRVTGAPVAAVKAPASTNYTVYFDSTHADTTMIMVVAARGTTLGAGPLADIQVPDTRAAGRYGVVAVQASDQSNALLPAAGGFSLSVGAP